MFPEINLDEIIDEELQEEEKTEQGITYLYDFKKGDFVLKDGRLVIAKGKEGIKIWIEKLLLTEEFKFEVYKESSENEYGTTIKRLIQGKKIPQLLLQSELKRIIEEKLIEHVEIERIENFNTTQEVATLIISFTVILKNQESFSQEVIF